MEPEDLRVSVSKTKTFDQCKKQYEFAYILKLPKKDREYHTFGKFCHRVLELFHNTYIAGCLLPYHLTMKDCFKQAYVEFKSKMNPEMKKECWGVIDQYLRLITKDQKNNTSAQVVACEKKFEIPLSSKLILNGVIDKVQVDDDNVLVVADYKTTKNKKYLKNDWFQLMTYGFVMLKENPQLKKIRGSYILLRHGCEYITREFSASELLSVEQKYIDYANQILAEKEFIPSPSILCSYCDFLNVCEAGQKQTRIFNGAVDW